MTGTLSRFAGYALCAALVSSVAMQANATEAEGVLQLTIRDAKTGAVVPARVEVRGADGVEYVADDALRVGGDCDMSDRGAGFTDLESTLAGFSDRLYNHYARTTQFYSEGTARVRLPAGPAQLRVFRGPEYTVYTATVDVSLGDAVEHEARLARWADLPARGWYSADDHLHIPRPSPELDPVISKMMQAEDLHVANLLQMGKVVNTAIATQHAHGPDGHYREGNYLLAAGQENPRTHFLGHTITLGAERFRHDPERYLIYRLLWEQSAKDGAIHGFAHAFSERGSPIAPHDGMAVVLPHDLLHFVEVLQFNRSGYDTWYDLLALGFRVTPTAGTDFPCADQTLPGHERFYTRVEGPLTYAKWLEAVRNGRTFVTSGPMLDDFAVGDAGVGGDVALEGPGPVRIRGRVRFDPVQDDLAFLELLQNGEVVGRFSRVEERDHIAFDVTRRVAASSWFAVRGYGVRLQEDPLVVWEDRGSTGPLQFHSFKPTSNVHSAPVYVSVAGAPGIRESPRSKRVAATWLARLDDLEAVLAEENLEFLGERLQVPNFDAVPAATLRANRAALLQEIAVAKTFFRELAD